MARPTILCTACALRITLRLNSATPEREKAESARANELIARAEQHHSNSKWKEAVADATEALKIDARSARAYNVRGDALIPTALLSDSPGAPSGGRFVIHWREEDSRHGISGKIADGFYGR